jgi:acyl-CoA thioester hydrolase
MKRFKTFQGTIYQSDCDHMGHMNVMHYVGKFDQATWYLFASIGLTGQYFKEQNRGMVALEQNIIYSKELIGDCVYVESTINSVSEKVIKLTHNMYLYPSKELVATTSIVGLHMDTVKRKGISLPMAINKSKK